MRRAALFLCAGFNIARAQYTLDWTTADAGGGRSEGGSYALTGTIAQTDAATPAAGGSITLDGGYWTFSAAEETLPDLAMILDSGFVVLAWAETSRSLVLESSADLDLWQPVEPQPAANAWIGPQSERGFFRLRPAP